MPKAGKDDQLWLTFKGINYRANIWLNGKKIASSDEVVGTYRDFTFNVTSAVDRASKNMLYVEVLPPGKNDLAITFVDWAPKPPDQNMGLWQDVSLSTTGPLALRYPYVNTDLDLPELKRAKLTIYVDVVNATDKPVAGQLKATFYAANGDRNQRHTALQDIKLGANETRTIKLSPDDQKQLTIDHPQVWWPWQLGERNLYNEPNLYNLGLELTAESAVSDKLETTFGIRDVKSRLENGHRLFTVNGIDLLIVGGGYAPDLLQRRSMKDRPNWQEDHIRYVRDMNLNTVRLEGKLEDDAFYELCDRYGVLVMAGWCCCSPWEQWKNWKDEQTKVAMESLRYQIRRARNHPSLVAWLNGSDNPPPKKIEEQYLAIEDELKWPCPIISSATAKKSSAEPSGVKMEGPYKWVPPIFWLTDKKTGGAWGFNTEVGPGAVPPPLESLETMLGKDHLWPPDKVWDFHCGGGEFKSMKDFTDALAARYGKPTGLADFAWKSQAQAYETIRAMYEGFRAKKFEATGEIQWMLNNAWPSMIWHLYDYYFRPGGAYFATKIACEPLHVLYRYDNGAVVVANDSRASQEDLIVTADIYDIDSKLQHHQETSCAAPANKSTTAFTLEPPKDISTTYFLRLMLKNKSQKVVSTNSYWLSTKPDVLDWSKTTWNITPCSTYADFTTLEKLPKVKLDAESPVMIPGKIPTGDNCAIIVKVTNNSDIIALLVRLKLAKSNQSAPEVLPIRWSDNYFMLLPGEKKELTAHFRATDLSGPPSVEIDCFNNGRT